MRSTLSVICVMILALVVAKLGVDNRRTVAENERLVAALEQAQRDQSQAEAKAAKLEHEAAVLKRLSDLRDLEDVQARSAAMRAGSKVVPSAAVMAGRTGNAKTAQPGHEADFLGKLGDLMKKPEMQDAMRAQQKLMLGTLYGSLFRKLNLPPDGLEKLKDILVDRQMAGVKMLGASDKKAAMSDIVEREKQTDAAVKDLLGDESYRIYQDYQSTLGERLAMNQFTQQLADKDMALDDVQVEELITLMVQERQKLNIGSWKEQQQAWASSGGPSADLIEKQMQQQEELQKQILANAGSILSEAQMKELKAFQGDQLQAQKLGFQMMKSFMDNQKKE